MADEKVIVLEDTLNQIAKGREYKNYKLVITPISSGGANYSSRLYAGKVTAPNEDDINWFGKVAIISQANRDQMPVHLYLLEQFAYTKLLRCFEDIENKYGVPQEYRLLKPKMYGYMAKPPHEVIVLQDLSAEGYNTHSRQESFQWPYASAVVQQLAIFHALSYALELYFPEEYEELLAVLKEDKMNESLGTVIEGPIKNNVNLIKKENRERLMKYLESEDFSKLSSKIRGPGRRPVLSHGDFRISNIMQKVCENGEVSIIIIDYQTYYIGTALNDLMYFIFTGSDGEFRKQHYQQLLDHYYEQLSLALTRLGLDPDKIFPREDFDYESRKCLKNGLLLAFFTLPLVTVDTEEAPELDDDLQIDQIMMTKANDVCAKRLNEIVEDFIEWGEI